VAIAGNIDYCLALRSNGTVAGWGNVPSIPGLSGIVGIAAGEDHCLAVNSAGQVIAWGGDESGQIEVPGGLAGVSAVRAAWNYSLALSGGGGVAPFQLTNPHWKRNHFFRIVEQPIGTKLHLAV
jgi:alpha-tubulin suppressor-like RCC1 family protein